MVGEGFSGTPDAEFNSGLALIFQLDGIEKELIIVTAQPSRNYFLHYNLLISYWKTLYPQINKKPDREAQQKKWDECKSAVGAIRDAQLRNRNSVDPKFIKCFDEWEMELRDLKQKYGLGTKRRDARFALMGD